MPLERGGDVGAFRDNLETLGVRVGHQRLNQPCRDTASADRGRHQSVFGNPRRTAPDPGQTADLNAAGNLGAIFAGGFVAVAGDDDFVQVAASIA